MVNHSLQYSTGEVLDKIWLLIFLKRESQFPSFCCPNPPNELKPIAECTDTSTFTIYSNDKRELWWLTNGEHLNFWVGCGPVDVRFLSRVWMTCTWHRTCTWINTWQIPAPIATQLTAQTKMFLYATQNSETFWIILDVIVFGDPSSTCSRYLRMAAFRE